MAEEQECSCHLHRVAEYALSKLPLAHAQVLRRLGPLQHVQVDFKVVPWGGRRPLPLPFAPPSLLWLECWAYWTTLTARVDALVYLHHTKNNVASLLHPNHPLYSDIETAETMLLR